MAFYSLVSLGRRKQRPYYVVTPPYSRYSAGIRALHLTVHHLNCSGQLAFAAILPGGTGGKRVSDELSTPELTEQIAEEHFKKRLTPIVVYPEIITGNPLQAAIVVRFYLNYPGLLGGSVEVNVDEIRFGYSQLLAEAASAAENVLHVPVIDTAVFTPEPEVERDVTCFYAHKYRLLSRQQPFGLPPGCIEIVGWGAATPSAIAELLRRSRRLYLFEDSALGTEAVLCGCPVVLMHNEYFKAASPLLVKEIGENGFVTSDDPAALQHAERTIDQARQNYFALWKCFPQQLKHFVWVTQANAPGYLSKVDLGAIELGQVPPIARRRGLLRRLRSLRATIRHTLRKR